MKWFCVIAVCLLVGSGLADRRGQLLNQRKPTASTWTDPSGSNTLFAWWVSSDLATNVAVWNSAPLVDRVQGILAQYVNNNVVSNNANGIYPGGGGLTNAPLVLPTSNHTVCVIFRPLQIVSGDSTVICLFGPYGMGDAEQGSTPGGFSFKTNNQFLYWGQWFAGGSVISAAIENNVTYDLIAYQNGSTITFDTNGVQSASLTRVPPATGWPWRWIGDDTTSAANPLNGWIKEVMVWSNSFSTVQISNVHYYATNTYSYSP